MRGYSLRKVIRLTLIGRSGDIRLGLLTVVALALSLPASAHAQGVPFGPFVPQEDYPPGVTVTGGGLARVAAPKRLSDDSIEVALDAARPVAVGRAVRDARRRAASVARGEGIVIGAVRKADLRQLFFERGHHCRSARPTRCKVPAFVGASATVTFEIVGGAEPDEDARTLEAYGSFFVPVEPADPLEERSIRRALLSARDTATPAAAARARSQVDAAASAAGVSVGTVVSIAEQASYYPDAALGTVGPRRYCRVLRHRRFLGVDRRTGRPRIERGPPRRRCLFPHRLSVTIEATYTAR
jgi:hypothetical protein